MISEIWICILTSSRMNTVRKSSRKCVGRIFIVGEPKATLLIPRSHELEMRTMFHVIFRRLVPVVCLVIISNCIHGALKTKVAIVGFQKNELEMLDFWLGYHSSLFGATNIAILDNYSDDPRSLAILTKWSKEGVIVVFNQGPYEKKGQLTTNAFHEHFNSHGIAIPLDIDEIIVSYRDNIPMVNRTLIHSDVDLFITQGKPCGAFTQYFANQPLNTNETLNTTEYFSPEHAGEWYAKKYMRMEVLAGLDHGNHHAIMKYRITHDHCQFDINHLGLLHYLNAEPKLKLRKSLQDCIGFGYLPNNMTVENLGQFGPTIEKMRNASVLQGEHKLKRVIKAYDEGADSLFSPIDKSKLVHLGNFADLLSAVKQD